MKRRNLQETRKSRKARTVPFQLAYNTILARLVAAREEAGLTQRQVSARMGRAPNFLTKCESGERSIDLVELLHLAQIYEKPVIDFLCELSS